MKDLEKKRSRKQDPKVTKRAGNGNPMGMMATIVMQTHYCDISKWCMAHSAYWMLLWRFKMPQIWNQNMTASFLDFLHLEHAQVTHKHTEQPKAQLGSISLVDAKKYKDNYIICVKNRNKKLLPKNILVLHSC